MFKKMLIINLILLFTISVNAQNWFGNNKKIKGNGNVVTINRVVSDYAEIAVGGSFDVLLIPGKVGEITIEGEENILPYLETEVSGNSLEIKYKSNTNINATKKVTVTVTYQKIKKIALAGSGNISNNGVIKSKNLSISLGGSGNITLQIDADDIKGSIGGSGNIKLVGNSEELDFSIAGSGSIKAYELISNNLNASIAGSGSINVTVNSKIKAKVVGSGSIYYKGNPSDIDVKTVGSGNVVDRN